MRYLIFIITVLMIGSACQKDVDPVLPPFEEQLVVDAYIFTDEVAYVKLSKSFDYFGSFDTNTVIGKIITEADVFISDGEKTEKLLFLPIISDNRIVGVAFQGNPINGIKGKAGKNYNLKITYAGKTYEANSFMPPIVPLDSAWFDFRKDGELNERLGYMKVRFNEQESTGDAYRSFSKRIRKDSVFLTYFNSTFDDKFINGKQFDLNYTRPLPPNSNNMDDKDYRARHYDMNDTVVLKFCSIGRKEFDYFESVSSNIGANGNPFTTPYNVLSTISNGAVGVFCAYGSRLDTVILKTGKKFNNILR
jgi:hypothetical protein